VPFKKKSEANNKRHTTMARNKKKRVVKAPRANHDTQVNDAKVLYLIRHGESQGQVARHNGLDRKRDPSLTDAGLTQKGWAQATQIPGLLGTKAMSSIELVVSSPLTRALHTALVAFQDLPEDSSSLVVHYDICEIGSNIPENIPRPVEKVIHDLQGLPRVEQVDHESLKPENWPDQSHHESCSKKNDGNESIHKFLLWLAQEREETVIAVVCHYNVIQAALGPGIKPLNATPIACQLFSDGTIKLVS
jgi:broad specificity phosphatase PhoE